MFSTASVSAAAAEETRMAGPAATFEAMGPGGTRVLDLSRFVDPTPLTVHPRLALETVMEIFKKMGPRVVVVEFRGRVAGLVTVKDCLKYAVRSEAGERGVEGEGWERRVWEGMRGVGEWVGRIGGGDGGGRERVNAVGGQGRISDGTEEVDEGVELRER